jgi:DNA-binding GntR family transcriptional regulator
MRLEQRPDMMDECERRRRKNFRDELAHRNHEFHNAVLESSSSPRLYSITANLTRAPLMVDSFHFDNDHQLKRSLSEHRDLAGAIDARDSAAARAVMEAHLRLSYRTMLTGGGCSADDEHRPGRARRSLPSGS